MNPDDLKHIVEARKQLEQAGRRWPTSDRDTNWTPTMVQQVAHQHQIRNEDLIPQFWDWVDSFDDEITRAHALGWLAVQVDGPLRSEIRRRRSTIVRDLREQGWSWGDLANEFGITKPRAQQLADT